MGTLGLRRRGYQVMTGAVPQGEIDFIVTRGQPQIFIQVAIVRKMMKRWYVS